MSDESLLKSLYLGDLVMLSIIKYIAPGANDDTAVFALSQKDIWVPKIPSLRVPATLAPRTHAIHRAKMHENIRNAL